MDLFRKKIPPREGAIGLRKCLGAWDLTLLGIGTIIGTGIFVLPGVVAATQAGPAIILSFVVAGIACAFVALAYAELAASVGGCGGAYGYAYALFGELIAWIIGWNLVFGMCVGVAATANGWSGYLDNAMASFGINLPDFLTRGPSAGGLVNLPVAIILALMALLLAGVRQFATLNGTIVLIKLTAIAIFIGVALFHIRPSLWQPFMPFGWLSYAPEGTTAGVLSGAASVVLAYSGFQLVSSAVEEARNPQRDLPIGILAALAICTLLYIAVSGLLTAIAPYATLNVSSPIAFALLQVGIDWGSALVAVGVIVGLTSTMLVGLYAMTRFLFAMARDGLMPNFLGRISADTQVPASATILCGVATAAIAGLAPFGALVGLRSVTILAEFALVCGGVVVLRLTRPDMERPFKIPGGLILPMLGALSSLALIGFLPAQRLLLFLLWLAVGVFVYFGYAARRISSAATPILDPASDSASVGPSPLRRL